MPHLSIKDVPEHWAEALRQRAARNHRSLQGELMHILEQAVHAPAAAPADPGAMRAGQTRGWKSIEQVSAELHAKYPKPITDVPTGRDIIRAERDAR